MLEDLSVVIGGRGAGEDEQAGGVMGTEGIYQDMAGPRKLHGGLFAIKDRNLSLFLPCSK